MRRKLTTFTLSIFIPALVVADTSEIDDLFDWAESAYSSQFSPEGQKTNFLGGWSYRYYPETGTYLGVDSDDNVYVMGGAFGEAPSNVGSLSNLLVNVYDSSTGSQNNNTDQLGQVEVFFTDSLSHESSGIQPFDDWYYDTNKSIKSLEKIYSEGGRLVQLEKINMVASHKQFFVVTEK